MNVAMSRKVCGIRMDTNIDRHFEDVSNKRNPSATNATVNVVSLQENLPMVNTFG